MSQEVIWKIINKYFNENPYAIVDHNIQSFNRFFHQSLKLIMLENNPIKILKKQNDITNQFDYQCRLYLGGRNGDKIYYGKPIIYDDEFSHIMTPNEARLRNMTYGMSIQYDVDVEYDILLANGQSINKKTTLEKIYLGKFPIMLHSDFCILKGVPRNIAFNLGECKNDKGGYFIIDGKEKSIVSQEKFADNMLYCRNKLNAEFMYSNSKQIKNRDKMILNADLIDNIYSSSVEVKSRSEDASKPVRTTYVRLVAPSPILTNGQIVVMIPNVKKPIPLFIVMRALGILSDKAIIETCILDINKHKQLLEYFRPSVHDAHNIFTQQNALLFIKEFTKEKTVNKVLDILMNYFIAHVSITDFKAKALYLGYMVQKLLNMHVGIDKPTDRDNFMYKRIELPGVLLTDLFKEYYKIMLQNIYKKIDKEYYYHDSQYQEEKFMTLVADNYNQFFNERDVEIGFKKAFKGNWGAQAHTKRMGIVQDLNRLSFNSFLSGLRKLNLPLDDSAKVVGPRLLHGSQIGYIDPVDTPDGGNIGLHKHLAIMTKISTGESKNNIIKWMTDNHFITIIQDLLPYQLAGYVKVFVNGCWVGVTMDPFKLLKEFKAHRRINVIPIQHSISFIINEKTIYIMTDYGRLLRPIFYINDNKLSLTETKSNQIIEDKFKWNDLVYGTFNHDKYYSYISNIPENKKAIIDYIDVFETASSLICFESPYKHETHQEIHSSLMLGVMGNQIVFPANNQLPRDLFFCGQGKQAVSLYSSNYQVRIDKMGVVLNNGQVPLIKTKYLDYITHEEHPYGENVIVAIGCYGGYNVEDSILFNQGSIDRGMFRTTYLNSYETREESSTVKSGVIDSVFTNIESQNNVINTKPGYDYSYLDKHGLIKENTEVNDKMILIGKTIISDEDPDILIDDSVKTKKGQLGFVDKTFITDGEEGFRIAKVRIREDRIPAIGDKFCSRCGQKGTIGRIIPEEDMPFTETGIRPDIIVNPHAFPSRMTIGQLVEVLFGKVGLHLGYYGDCTAFVNKGSKHAVLGSILNSLGYNSKGEEILYNGETGEQIVTSFYMGPTYYMRLKHMVKDKINYRAKGPRQALTRQTVQGRANEGGLRIGEMERDTLISHGISYFLKESMMVRGDQFLVAICNNSGTIAIYNETKNIFLSPMIDGPIKFLGTTPPHESGKIQNISKYGKSFSIVQIPYSFKLLIQELLTMNICVHLITKDNIEQVTSLSYSNTIKKELFNLPSSLNTKLDFLTQGQDTESQGQDTGSQGQDTESQGQDTGSQGQDTESQGQDTGSQGQDTGSQGQDTGSQGQDTGSQGQDTGLPSVIISNTDTSQDNNSKETIEQIKNMTTSLSNQSNKDNNSDIVIETTKSDEKSKTNTNDTPLNKFIINTGKQAAQTITDVTDIISKIVLTDNQEKQETNESSANTENKDNNLSQEAESTSEKIEDTSNKPTEEEKMKEEVEKFKFPIENEMKTITLKEETSAESTDNNNNIKTII